MKASLRKFLPGAFAALVVGVLACNQDDASLDAGKSIEISADLASRTTDFAFDFFKNLKATQPADQNVFVSPLSLHIALGMLLNGAEGETAAELRKGLKVDDIAADELNRNYKALIDGLPLVDPKVTLGLANSVWYKNTFLVETNFLDVLRTSFDAEVTGLEFNDAAKNRINAWASDKTRGRIPKVIDEIKPSEVMFLLNALYFKGDWQARFDAQKTKDKPFFLLEGSQKTVRMMAQVSDFNVAFKETYDAVELPYANGRYNLTLLLPKESGSVNALIDDFDVSDWNALQADGFQKRKVSVMLPRFTLKYEVNLNSTLEHMGIARMFTSAAQLGAISKSESLEVSFVKQNTFLGVDEKGTEAAAVTTIGVELTSIPVYPTLSFDRPFLFIISEKTSATILFMGRIMNP